MDRSFILPCEADGAGRLDLSKSKIVRHPVNYRRYRELDKTYAQRMLEDGYDEEDA